VRALGLLALLLMLGSFWALLVKGVGFTLALAGALAAIVVLFLIAILGALRQRDDGHTEFSRDGFGGWR
jgi:hypothetical protein